MASRRHARVQMIIRNFESADIVDRLLVAKDQSSAIELLMVSPCGKSLEDAESTRE